jgi:exodeoxyribonuclease V alpha subunit
VTWIPDDVAEADAEALTPVCDGDGAAGRALIGAGSSDARRALETLAGFRVLCAHHRGAHGVATWMDRIERWLAAEVDGCGAEGPLVCRPPLLVTANDYDLRLYNGDTGVVVATEHGGVGAAFHGAARSSSSAPRGSAPSTRSTR